MRLAVPGRKYTNQLRMLYMYFTRILLSIIFVLFASTTLAAKPDPDDCPCMAYWEEATSYLSCKESGSYLGKKRNYQIIATEAFAEVGNGQCVNLTWTQNWCNAYVSNRSEGDNSNGIGNCSGGQVFASGQITIENQSESSACRAAFRILKNDIDELGFCN